MIPKIIFQTSIYKPVSFQVETIKYMSKDWEYKHFTDSEIIEFLNKNYIKDFKDPVSIFLKLNGAHKADFFRYYFLYVNGGVYVDSDARLEVDINEITNGVSFFTVISAIEKCKIFNGFIGCEPGNKIIYECIKWIYRLEVKEYFDICRNLKVNYDLYHSEKDVLFKEEIIGDIAKTFSNNKVILTHYFTNKVIESLVPIKKTNKLKIGITFNLPKKFVDLYCSGINQHSLFFCELLLNINYDVYLIATDKNIKECTEVKQILYDPRFKVVNYLTILKHDFSIVFDFGFSVDQLLFKMLRKAGTKIIAHKCGNEYLIKTENILYNLKRNQQFQENYYNYDEVWSIPQMMNTNKHFWETIHRSKVIEAPFIWSNKLIDHSQFLYKNRNVDKKIGILEPNLSLMKCCIPPIIICENAYRNKKPIDRVYITNISSDSENFNLHKLTDFVKCLDLRKDNKISVEPRMHSLGLLANHGIDIVVSHQWENPLNYLYFDIAWMGWPIVHNASLCKDVGYYYEGFNYEEGGNMLSYVIDNHHLESEEYLIKNRKYIDRYLPSNKELQNMYISMMEKVLNGDETCD